MSVLPLTPASPGGFGRSLSPRWLVLGVVLGLLACESPPPAPTPPKGSSLFLRIQSSTGEPVAKARVHLRPEVPDAPEVTDEQGQLLVENLPEGTQLVQVEAEGIVSTSMNFTVNEGVQAGARIETLSLGEPVKTFNTSEGTTLESGHVRISIRPGTLVDAQGRPIQGEVDVYLRVLDLEGEEGNELRLAPGVQRGLLRPGLPVGLESLGVMALVFKQKGPGLSSGAADPGDVSVFARRIGIRGRVPSSIRASALAVDPPVDTRWQIPLWRWDASSGYWIATGELGTFLEISAASAGSAEQDWDLQVDNPPPVFNVAMPYSWRAPDVVPGDPLQHTPAQVESATACLEVLVQAGGQPVAGREVVVTGVDYMGLSRGLTDASGRVLLDVMRDKQAKVAVGGWPQEVRTASAAPGSCPEQGTVDQQSWVTLMKSVVEPTAITIQVDAPLCVPGATTDCPYGGPKGTRGKGICQAARSFCDVEGMKWGACGGEVLPRPKEVCTNAEDDDCDGTPNEGCPSVCQPGDTQPCYDDEGKYPDTKGIGECKAGERTCEAGGTAWSECKGQTLPEPEENFSRPGDENCDGEAFECWPGATEECGPYSGPSGTQGVGACQASTRTCEASSTGASWSACQGEVTPLPQEDCTTPGDDNCDGTVNESSVCRCQPDVVESYYTGGNGTQGVGLCRAGTRQCNASGTGWVVLTEQVTPLPQEDCTTPNDDDDCDGTVNQSTVCVCQPDVVEECGYTGPSGTKDVGLCRAGTKQCNASGTAWGTCSGEVTPQEESCANATDEDCDGQVDENPPCGWVAKGAMAAARYEHTATLLGNGKVLVSGGEGSSGILNTAEVYDPATNTWTVVSPMGSPRARHAATLLGDGKVLVVGGDNGNDTLKTAEVYDPATNTWTVVSNMNSERLRHTATLLGNGKVLVVGGWEDDGWFNRHHNTAEVYDLDTNTWSSAGTMASARDQHTATLLGNGKVLVVGGYNGGDGVLKTAEVYDPATNTWSSAVAMSITRDQHTTTLLGNGKVLVSGGSNSSAHSTAEVYDLDTNTWSSAGNMAKAREVHTATLLGNGKVLVSGGRNGDGTVNTAEVYDPATNTWSPAGTMTAARELHTVTLLGNGQVLIAGGLNGGGALNTAEAYDPGTGTATNTWSSRNSMSLARREHTATRLANGKVFVAGGRNVGGALDAAAVYDPTTDTWVSVDAMTSIRARHTATLLGNGKVLVAGGYDATSDFHVYKTAEVYDPATRTWSSAGTMNSVHRYHTATLLNNGKVLVAGGYNGSGSLSAAEVYDWATNTWLEVGPMATARTQHAATLLGNGKVLVSGGRNGGGAVDAAEVYDPATGTWSSAGTMAAARDQHTATLLSNGKVLVAGGSNSSAHNTAEVYDPVTNTWTVVSVSTMATAREMHTATLLNNGKVLVSGGHNGAGPVDAAEVYDPATNTWSSVASMSTTREQHTATLLGNGKVLVTGGKDSDEPLTTAEVYGPATP